MSENTKEVLLDIKDLQVHFETSEAYCKAVNGLDLVVKKGEIFGIVGETGAGKTTTALSILNLLPDRITRLPSGVIEFEGNDILKMSEDQMREIRGSQISMIFQDPMTSLNPVLTVGDQIGEAIETHHPELNKKEVSDKVDEVLNLVGIAPSRKSDFPHQFSGGMKQRVVIAMALVCEPKLLIADEPTTALDVTVQNQVLQMMLDLKEKMNTSMILITHDLGIVCEMCDNVAIMYAGEVIEAGSIYEIFDKNKKHHPYTEGLFGSLPSIRENSTRLKPVSGLMPDPAKLPEGCKFHPRCDYCMEICSKEKPPIILDGEHKIRCHLELKGGV